MRKHTSSEPKHLGVSDLQRNLLSLAHAGETIRFRWSRAKPDEKYSLTLEGLGTDQASGKALGLRIAAFLSLLREQGIDFHIGETLAKARKPKKGRRWVRIAPRPHVFATDPQGHIGFLSTDNTRGPSIRFPALQALSTPDLTEYPMDLLAHVPGVASVSLSFTRQNLSQQAERVLAKTLNRPFTEVLNVADAEVGHPPLQRFMALWLVRRTGWRMDLLAEVEDVAESSEVPLVLLGREWFDTDCHVLPAVPPEKSDGQVLDFSCHYPDGWAFPPFFPAEYASDRLQVEARLNTRVPELPKEGVAIGIVNGRDVLMPTKSRDLHTYVLGGTGTGKSTLLKRLISHDIQSGEAVVLLDPHGDLYHEVLDMVPASRRHQVVAIDPGKTTAPPGFNLFDFPRDEYFHQHAESITGELIHFFKECWADTPEAFGPMFEIYFRNTVLLMIHRTAEKLSLDDFERVMTDKAFRNRLLEACPETTVVRFWKNLAERAGGESSLENVAPYFCCKVSPLVQSYFIGKMLGHPKDEQDIDGLLQRDGILLVSLNKGTLSHLGSRLLGGMIACQLFAAGLRRSLTPRANRRPVNIFIDEFQNFVSPTVASIFAEARKFGLRLHVANQTLGQLNQSRYSLQHSVLGNVGNQVFFRIGVQDTEALAPFFDPVSRREMQELPNYHALVRLMTPAGPLRPFMMKTVL